MKQSIAIIDERTQPRPIVRKPDSIRLANGWLLTPAGRGWKVNKKPLPK